MVDVGLVLEEELLQYSNTWRHQLRLVTIVEDPINLSLHGTTVCLHGISNYVGYWY